MTRTRPAVFLLLYTVITSLFAWFLVTFRAADSLMIILVIPVLLAAYFYPRRIYLAMLAVLISLSIWVTSQISSSFFTSIETIIIGALTVTIMVELTHKQVEQERRIQAALETSDERYRLFVQNFQGIAFRGMMDFTPVFFHGAVEKITGYSETEFLNGSVRWDQIIHPGDQLRLQQSIWKIRDVPDTSLERDYRITRKDGQVRWIHELIQNLADAEGRPTWVQGTLYDVTTARLAEQAVNESEARFRTIFESSPLGLELVDVDTYRLVRMNRAFCEMIGYSPDELLTKTLKDITYPDDLENDLGMLERVISGELERYTMEKRYIRSDGEIFWANLTCTYTLDPAGKLYALGIVENITEKKAIAQAEAEQRALADALRDIAGILNSSLELNEVLDYITTHVGRVVPHDAVNIEMIEDDHVRVMCGHGYETYGVKLAEQLFAIHNKELQTFSQMMETRRPVVISDVREYPGWLEMPESYWVRSYLGAPILVKGETIGFINLDSATPGFFVPAHGDRLQAFADQAALAIENARLYAEVQRLAIMDVLTNLYNRRGFFEIGAREVERAARFNHRLSAIFVDIDHFKLFNDNYSHAVGDQVLTEVAARLKKGVREVDIAGRYAGDEFVILLPETDRVQAYQVAIRLCQSIGDVPVVIGENHLTVTASVGVAEMFTQTPDLSSLLNRADMAMFAAKQAGRNQVIMDASGEGGE